MFDRNILTKIGLAIVLVTSPVLQAVPVAAQVTETSAESLPNQHFIIDVSELEQTDIGKIVIDASAIGGQAALEIPLELKRISLSAPDCVDAGTYVLPVTATNTDGEIVETLDYPVTIKALANDGESHRDWDEEIIYFLLTDRFYDGNSDNNNPYDLDYAGADNPRGVYQGGDFAGITEKLAYLSDLGITTIWISPIVANIQYDVSAGSQDGAFYGYHGYWAQNFEELNPHFGTLEEFHTLIDQAASYDMNIMVDVVLNHTGYGLHPLDGARENSPAGYPTDEDRAVFEDMLRLETGRDALTESLSGLPDFITEDPAIREQIVAWQTAWLDLATTPNGNSIASFRVDTAIHVDPVTLQHFRNELTTINPDFKLIAEAWGADPINHKNFLNSGKMDSVLDFKFKETARNFINGNLVGANETLIKRNEALESNATAGQFLSSHDETGFLYMLNNHLGKYKLAVALQLTAKGQPVIYYGEELGQTGANNWPVYDNRYDLAWEETETENHDIFNHYQTLLDFRHNYSEILAKGNRQLISGSNEDGYILVERAFQDEAVYLLFSNREEAFEIELAVTEADAIAFNHYNGEQFQADGKRLIIPATLLEEGGTALLTLDRGQFSVE